MQPIIDIIYELAKDYIDAYLAAHPPISCFIDRGDPGSPDFTLGDLDANGVWTDLDLGSIVPANAQGVLLRVNFDSPSLVKQIAFRKKGHTHYPNVAYCLLSVAGVLRAYDKTVSLDTDRVIQYRLSTPPITAVQITVAAWYTGDFGTPGLVNRGDPAIIDFDAGDFTIDSAWHTLDLSAIIPVATNAVLMRCRVRCDSSNRGIYFRTDGNVNTINRSQCQVVSANDDYYYDIVVPTAGLQTIEYLSNIAAFPVIELTVKAWLF